jgi:hypothetical protein
MQEAAGADLTNVDWSARFFLFRFDTNRRLHFSPSIVSARPIPVTARLAMTLDARSQPGIVARDRREIAGIARARRPQPA